MQNGTNPPPTVSSNPVWITIVILTAALMVIFLLFFGTRSGPVETPVGIPQENTGQPREIPSGKADQVPSSKGHQ